MQQEAFRQWTRLWLSAAPGSTGVGDLNRATQKRWLELGLELLDKHRAALDSTYRSGIQLIEQTFQITDAKSGDDYRKLVEDLWRKLFDLQKQQAESQFRDLQAWFEKSSGLVQDARA
ncbi:MAG TPA: hypothetical protein VHL80_12715 [Polyangia bacterium]|nr:hypothetical protein [Polyangia bacterium]